MSIARPDVENFQEVAKLFGLTLLPNEAIAPGDTYIGFRHGRHALMTAKIIHPTWIEPTQAGYCFEIEECMKVRKGPV